MCSSHGSISVVLLDTIIFFHRLKIPVCGALRQNTSSAADKGVAHNEIPEAKPAAPLGYCNRFIYFDMYMYWFYLCMKLCNMYLHYIPL